MKTREFIGIQILWDKGYAFDYNKPSTECQTHGCIYMIRCPYTKSPIYIGRSIDFPTRCHNHMIFHKKKQQPINKHIMGLKAIGKRPIFEVVDLIEIDQLDYFERFYIDLFKSWGFKLLNK